MPTPNPWYSEGGALWNGTDEEPDFTNGTSTDHNYGDVNTLDPNAGGQQSSADDPDPDPVKDTDPINTRDKDKNLPPDKPDPDVDPVTDIDDPATATQEPPDTQPDTTNTEGNEFIEDGMDYDVPEATDVDTPTGSGTADVEQTMWDVTPEQTVAGQFEELYDRDSPIFELARQRAIRQHLGSGGQNSAMAAGFGEVAAMDKAFQMAQQDAATYARSAEFNAAMANQYSLAEQRFIHNALLSDQAFEQAKSLQTQRIAAQLESIVLDYKGRSLLMDKELDQWFMKASKEFEYEMGKLAFQLDGEKQMLNIQALSNFWVNGFNSVMTIAGNPNLTPEQSRAAMAEGMAWFASQRDAFTAFMNGLTGQTGTPDFQNYNWQTGSTESIQMDENGYPNWGDWGNYGGVEP